MKIRTAKKIMGFGPNHRSNKHQCRRFEELRPAYVNEQGRKVYPSWHDIDIIRRAHTRFFRWIRRYENKQSKLKNI